MSHFSVLAVVELPDMDLQSEEARTRLPSAVTGALDQMMAPYDENAKEGDHLVFQEDEGLEEDYAECVVNCVKTPDGRILSASDPAFSRRFLIWEGKIFQKSAGQLHHLKRTKKAKKYTALPAYPVRKFYRTLQAFAEDYLGCVYNEQEGKYGYYRNPNAKWDWFQIGGRWPYAFLVKEGCWSVIPSELSWACQNEEARKAPEGYRWVSGARKTDIQWEMMKQIAIDDAMQEYETLKTFFEQGWIDHDNYPLLHITYKGIEELGHILYYKGETQQDYLNRNGLSTQDVYPCTAYTVLDDENWMGRGDVGIFGLSCNDMDDRPWNDFLQAQIAQLPDDAFLVKLDCHI